MEKTELLADEWQALQMENERLGEEIARLNRKLINLAEDPIVRQLLEEKEALKKRLKSIQKESYNLERQIEDKILDLERKTLLDSLARLQGGLKNSIAMSPSDYARRNEKFLLGRYRIDRKKMDIVQQREAEYKLQVQQEKIFLQGIIEDCIDAIEQKYRLFQHVIKQMITDVAEKKSAHEKVISLWLGEDKDHLHWVLSHKPAYRDQAIRAYKLRFPNDDLNDVTAQKRPTISRISKKERKKRAVHVNGSAVPIEKIEEPETRTWKYFITFHVNDHGQELPENREQFIRALVTALDDANYRGLDATLVYDKLTPISVMTVQQRQAIRQIFEGELFGWKIVWASKKHRLFLSINESKREIRFMPYQRKKSYGHH